MDSNEKDNKLAEVQKEKDIEDSQPKLKYPRSIPFIVVNEFCERFNFYGMKAILVLYLTRKLLYDDNDATIIYHTFTMLVYFMCIFGAIIADSFWGRFKTIVILSIVYSIGSVLIAIGAVEPWNLPAREFTIIGLLVIAIGSGGIKPCVAAFGGEQFKLPEQARQLAAFFSAFYFSVNAGSLLSTSVTPILREDVDCFGMGDCFPLAFGVPAILMIVATAVFLAGKFMYVITPLSGNMLVRVCSCLWTGMITNIREKKTNPKEYWLEHAEAKHGRKLVLETKILLNILKLYVVLPVFWALFDQQGSRWTFQATRMNGDIGFMEVKPDQMQVINPALILIFIPLYEFIFYPLLSMIGIRRPLQKLTLGGTLAGVAFVISGIVELTLEQSEPNTMSILWQIPQYVVLTLGEVMFSVTGLQFSFTQAPESMKSVLMGSWNLTIAFGNLIVILVTSIKIFDSQAYEFFLFAGLMFVDMAGFSLLAYYYKPIPLEMLNDVDEEDSNETDKLKKSPLDFNGKDNPSFDNRE